MSSMPYKSRDERNAASRRSKEKYRKKYLISARAYYYRTRGPLKPKAVRTPDELKAMKAADDKRYREKHKEKVKNKKANYYQRNKKLINDKCNRRLKSNIQTRISHNIRSRIKQAIRREFRSGSAVKELGCSISDFKSYIEGKFSSGMSWKNYGEWHLDHIKPLCKFDLRSPVEFKLAVHYTNYQPLWAVDNLRKNKY